MHLRAIIKALPFLLPAALFVAGAGCTSSTDSCTGTTLDLSAACQSCATNACSSDYATFDAACCGTPTPGCGTETSALEECLLKNCKSECQVKTTTASCSSLSTCCGQLSSTQQSGCQAVVAKKDEPSCASALEDFRGLGLCN